MRMLSGAEHEHLMQVRDRFLSVLVEAMDERDRRPDWMAYEREVLTDAVNEVRRCEARSDRYGSLVTSEDVRKLEGSAEGATYAEKLAFYCARLALGYED